MRRVQLFIATSIDGFIACPDGSISWLFSDADHGYEAFFEQTDTVLMGRKTFQQVLEMGEWPYPSRHAYVFSHNTSTLQAPKDISDVHLTSQQPSDVVSVLKSAGGKNIWLVGGASITGELLQSGLIDDMIISVHPLILGQGVPLVSKYSQPGSGFEYWELVSTTAFPSGLVQLSYRKQLPVQDDAAPKEQLPSQDTSGPAVAPELMQITKAESQPPVC